MSDKKILYFIGDAIVDSRTIPSRLVLNYGFELAAHYKTTISVYEKNGQKIRFLKNCFYQEKMVLFSVIYIYEGENGEDIEDAADIMAFNSNDAIKKAEVGVNCFELYDYNQPNIQEIKKKSVVITAK
jgi:hypothetical protein